MKKVIVSEKLKLINEHWHPHIVGELNGQHVKLVKLKGEFIWHKHENEDELFYVLKGTLVMGLRNRRVEIKKNEFFIVPKGIEHKPIAKNEVWLMLFEPASTVNTGNNPGKLTRSKLKRI